VPIKEISAMIQELSKEMKEAVGRLEFEIATGIRNKIQRFEEMELKMR